MMESIETEPLIKKNGFSAAVEPITKQNMCNLFVLFVLYTLEGVPLGLIYAIQVILQNKDNTTFSDQAILSLAFWPFSVKILWAPLVDSLYVKGHGRRKSWLIPVQYSLGIFFLIAAFFINEWLINTDKPKVFGLTVVLFVIIFLTATQDIVVDGWALTMLKRKNIGYAAMCNMAGQSLGVFLGFVFLLFLMSETFWNYWRNSPQPGGIVSLQAYLYFWGVIFMAVATLIAVFKTEKDDVTDTRASVYFSTAKTYKLLINILQLPSFKLLVVFLLTVDIGSISVMAAYRLKLIDGGVTNNQIALIEFMYIPLDLCIPFIITKYTSKEKPLKIAYNVVPYRLFVAVLMTIVIFYTPTFLAKTGPSLIAYKICLVLIYFMNNIVRIIEVQLQLAFFAKISDPQIGSTNMALLSTVANMGGSFSYTAALWLIDVLTIKKCSNDYANSCSSENDQNLCVSSGGSCQIKIDGFYVETVFCTIFGIVWYYLMRKFVDNLQSKNVNEWHVENKIKESL